MQIFEFETSIYKEIKKWLFIISMEIFLMIIT